MEDTNRLLLRVLPSEEVYASHARALGNERAIVGFLDAALDNKPGRAATYVVECHATACKLTIDHAVAPHDWMMRLQRSQRDVALIAGFSFGSDVLVTLGDNAERPTVYDPSKTCSALEEELAAMDERIDQHLPVPMLFARMARSSEYELRMQPLVDAVFGAGARGYQLECHGEICRVEASVVMFPGWADRFQNSGAGKFVSLMIGSHPPNTLFAFGVFGHASNRSGAEHFTALSAELRRHADRIDECKRLHSSRPGQVAFELEPERGQRITVKPTGNLVGTPVADCLRQVVMTALRNVPVPEEPIRLSARPIRFWIH